MKSMRDVYFQTLTERAKTDESIVMVVADMGAPGLNEFKRLFPHRFINVGIAEQSAILVACGLALEGKKPVVFAIEPFISLRCYEQIKVIASLMNIPITIVGVGAGVSYHESGPTHHALEDFAIMRILPHMTVYTPSNNRMAVNMAAVAGDFLQYVRLDRHILKDPELSEYSSKLSSVYYGDGLNRYLLGQDESDTIVSMGNMVYESIKIGIELKMNVIDVSTTPVDAIIFESITRNSENIFVIEENNDRGGLEAEIRSLCLDKKIYSRGLCVATGYGYTYGGREEIHKAFRLDKESLIAWIKSV